MVLGVFFPKSKKHSLKPQKKTIFLKKIFSENFLWTHEFYFNRPWQKNFAKKVQTSFSHVPSKLLKTIFFQKIQSALNWLFEHVELTFVIPADNLLPNVYDFCPKSKNTCENLFSPKNISSSKCRLDSWKALLTTPPNSLRQTSKNFQLNFSIFLVILILPKWIVSRQNFLLYIYTEILRKLQQFSL